MKILLVTNFISHYRAPLFERLQREFGMEFILYSQGTEDYWQPHLGVTPAAISSTTITGREFLPKMRLNTGLLVELWRRDYDILIKCINGRLELPAAYAIAKLRRRPFVLWASLWRHPTTPFHRLSKPLLRHIYAHSDAIVCDGAHVARFVIDEGADPAKVFVAELAVDNEAFSAKVGDDEIRDIRTAVGAERRPLVLSVSRLVEQKGLDVLIEAVAGLRDLDPVLAVVGTGHLGPELAAHAGSRHVDLQLLGGRPPATMPPVYAAADVLVMASVTTPLITEVWGLAVNEAMCQGVPVVATSAVGAAAGGLVVDGETGLVVPERDHAALSSALRRLLEDPKEARRLGEAGRRRVVLTDYDAMVEGYRSAIAKAVEHVRQRPRVRASATVGHPPVATHATERAPQATRALVTHVHYRQVGGEDAVFDAEIALLRGAGLLAGVLDLHADDLSSVPLVTRARMALTYADHRYGRRVIADAIAGSGADLVHFHSIFPMLGPGAMIAASECGCATVQTLHNYRLSCLAGTHLLHGDVCERCRPGHYAAGVLNRCYRGSHTQSAMVAQATARQWTNFVERRVPTRAIALSDFSKDRYVGYGADPRRIVVKASSVDAGRPDAEPRSGVLYAGRLSPEKGVVGLVESWPADGPTLTVAGTGPLESQIHALERPNVRYLGQLSHKGARRELRRARVTVVPSAWQEPFNLVATESLSEGTPVVGFGGGPLSTMLAKLDQSCVVPYGDYPTLVTAAIATAQSDRWGELSERCLELHAADYSHEANLRALTAVYAGALAAVAAERA